MTETIDKSKLNKLQLLFLEEIKEYIRSTKRIKHYCEPVVDKKHYSYKAEIRPDHPGSYAVTAHVDPWEITIIFGGAHHHFTPDGEFDHSDNKAVEAALAFVDDLLHGEYKLVINKSNGKPYRWTFYFKFHDTWRFFSTTWIFWFNYFGHRSKEEIINKAESK
jgi:hypothetical protein